MRSLIPSFSLMICLAAPGAVYAEDAARGGTTGSDEPEMFIEQAPPPSARSQPTGSAPVDDKVDHATGITHNEPHKVWQAEEWVAKKNSPWITPEDAETEKKNHKGPVRHFVKSVAKGIGKELAVSGEDLAKDMVLVFSVQDVDPYEVKSVPKNRPAIVLKFHMMDGSSCYLRRFPDGSYAVEEGFANGTVLIPRAESHDYLVKYPNGVQGRMVKTPDGTYHIYRPDKTITTIAKTASGGYTMSNTKFGYMGEARPDDTGVMYEVGAW